MTTLKDKNYKDWARERKYVLREQGTLRSQYGNDYIAVRNCQVVDHDKDKFELNKRVSPKFRGEFVLISAIEDIVNPQIVHMRSPFRRSKPRKQKEF